MKKIVPDAGFIGENFNKTLDLVNKLPDSEKKKNILRLFDTLGERYALCPASHQKQYFSAFPGGLCFHNLNVYENIKKFASTMSNNEFSNESLLIVSLFHDLGKVGDVLKDLYLPQISDWHRKRGIMYELNPDIQYMKTAHRSLYLLQFYEIMLTQNEYLAILLNAMHHDEANRSYAYKENELSYVLYFADMWAIQEEKKNYEY